MKKLTQTLVLLFFFSFQPPAFSQDQNTRLDSLRRILPKAKGVHKLQVLSDISEAYLMISDADNFLKNQKVLEKEFTQHPEGSEEVRLIFYCNQAGYYSAIGDIKNTILLYQKALEVKSDSKRALNTKVIVYLNLCEHLRVLKQFQEALEYLNEAQKLVEKYKLDNYTSNILYVYKANIYSDLTDLSKKAQSNDEKIYYKKTYDLFIKVYNVLKKRELSVDAEGLRWIQLYDSTAKGLYLCNLKKEANELFTKASEFLEKNNLSNFYYYLKISEYSVKNNDSTLNEKDYEKLIIDVDKTLNLKWPYLTPDIYGQLLVIKANALFKIERNKESIYYYEKAEKLIDQLPDDLLDVTSFDNMSITYEKLGNLKKAFEYKKKALDLSNKIKDNSSIEGEKKMQALLELERIKQAKQLEFEKMKSERTRNYAIMLLLGLVLTVVIVILLILFNKNLKTKQKLLVSELNYNKEVALKNELDSIYKVKFDIERQKALAESEKDIAKNLHDDLASGLAAMNFFIQDKASFATTDKDKKSFGEIKDEVNSMYEGLRKYIHNLYNNKNLVLSVNEYLYDLMRQNDALNSVRFNIKADFQKMDSLLNVFQQNQLYRIIKETVINSLKYSNSSNINVTIGLDKGRCQFSVEDDGQGFGYTSQQGIGLKNIQDRIGTLGGEVSVKSNPKQGVSLIGSFNYA